MNDNKVYLVFCDQGYDGKDLCAIFSTEELAEKYRARKIELYGDSPCKYITEVHTVDDPEVTP